MTEYLNPRTGETWPLDEPRWRAPDGSPLLLTPMTGLIRQEIETERRSLWRYLSALPVRPDDPITLGEGCTPLLRRMVPVRGEGVVREAPALLKCEWVMPTGSFKDRGASVMLSLLRAQGVAEVLEDSSGNGGASVAAYAAAGGMRATILAPEATSPAKMVQARAHGAAVGLIPGTRQDAADAAERRGMSEAGAGPFYASHTWHPFFLHGTKTLAYELWEDLGFRAPDNVIVPCGGGSNVLGCGIGFGELLRAQEIAALPRIWAAQPENCAPIAAAFLAGETEPVETPIRPTLAEGTAIARPVRLAEVLGVLTETRGGAVTLAEAEIARATLDLAAMGVYVEPASAQVLAAFGKLLASGAIAPEQETVLVLTGTGLKASPRIAELLATAS